MVSVFSILLAVGLPAFALCKQMKHAPVRYPYLFSAGSFGFCAWGIIAEILTLKQRLFAGDIGGIQDTIHAVIAICVVLAVVTVVLNVLLLGLTYEEQREHTQQAK